MPLSPLKTPASSRPSRRRQGPPVASLLMTVAAALLALWVAWRFGFGLPARVHRALGLAQSGRAEEALDRLNALAADHPTSAQVQDALGLALDRLDRPADAAAAYARARSLGLGASYARAHCDEGNRYLDRGDWDEAHAEFDQAIALSPGLPQASAGEGACAMAQGHVASADADFKRALAGDPGLTEAQNGARIAEDALSRGSLFSIIDRNGEPLARQDVSGDTLGAVGYPRAQLTAHVIGYLSQKRGDAGLERDLKPLFPADQVQLTLDARLQEAASQALGWRKGAIVALDVSTGEVLCAVSQPSFLPEKVDRQWGRLRDDPNQPLQDRALDGLFEPGSIAKIMTAAAALETGVDMAKLFPMTPPTAISLDGKIFRDWEYHGEIGSLKQAMAVSSNIALYRVAEAMGPDALLRMINLFGFNRDMDLGFDLADGRRVDIRAARPYTPQEADDQFDLANLSCGLGKGFRVSPLQAARMALVIADGGVLLKPQIVKSVRGPVGEILYQDQPVVEDRVMRAGTAARVTRVMEDTVEGGDGIGKRARVEGILIAGKTGTSRTHPHAALDAWFIGFAPADHPKLAVAVFCDREGTGMSVAAPIAGRFFAAALQ